MLFRSTQKMNKKTINAVIGLAVLTSSIAFAQNTVNLLNSTKVKFDNFYGGVTNNGESSASEQGVKIVWTSNPNQDAPISSGGFFMNLAAPVAAKDATLEIVAKGSNDEDEKLNNMVVTLLDADKKRCGRYTKSVGTNETPVTIKIVEMDKSDPDFTGDLSKVSQISIAFVAKEGHGGNAFLSKASLTLP